MIIDVTAPGPGESISEVVLAKWLVPDGTIVRKDQEIAEIESEKATLPLIAPESGKLIIRVEEGQSIAVGSVACSVDTTVRPEKNQPVVNSDAGLPVKEETQPLQASSEIKEVKRTAEINSNIRISPVAKKLMDDHGLSVEDVSPGGHRISKEDVQQIISSGKAAPAENNPHPETFTERVKISQFRKKLGERLVAAKNETAMLTTFNEVDMTNLLAIRKKYQDDFTAKFGVKLGLMSFFTRAVVESLKLFPELNSMIDGDEIVFFRTMNIGIAVQTPKGLMVPVIRRVEDMSFAGIENQIAGLAARARNNRISPEELSGGTFTITNGGVFGSLFSTPILNPPQAAILGMHNITDRVVALKGNVVIRPMMFIALSYDHRLVDGKDSVGFLVKVKEFIESPVSMVMGMNPEEILLGLRP